MTVSRHPPINEELISAYLDNEVTDEERSLVEAAIADDPAIAWQVDSLRQTIHLLQELPTLVLPRAFTLEAIVADAKRQEAINTPVEYIEKKSAGAKQASKEGQTDDWWQWLQQLWQGGNLQLRNAAALAFTLLLVLFVSNRFVAPYQPMVSQARGPIITQTTINGTGSDNSAANTENISVAAQLAITPMLEPRGKVLTAQPAVKAAATQEQPAETASAKQLSNQTEATTAESTAMTLGASGRGPGPDDGDLTGGLPNTAMQSSQPEGAAGPMQDNASMAATERFTPPNSASPSVTTALRTTVTTHYNAENQTTVALTLTPALTVTITDSVAAETVTPSINQSIDITASMEQETTPEAERDEMTSEAAYADKRNRWLGWAQMITALCTIVLGGLWWRSRE